MQEFPKGFEFQGSGEEGFIFGLGLVAFLALVTLVPIIINVVICLLIYSPLSRVPHEHRKMDPVMVWLLLIPCFSFVWNFFVFPRTSQSIRSYFRDEGLDGGGDCGEKLGLWFSVCAVASLVPYLGCVATVAALVLLIMYLVRINELKARLPAAA